MENPNGWDALTACLAVCPLRDLEKSWQFLLSQLVVLDGPGNFERFQEILRAENGKQTEEGVTGPSFAYQIATALSAAGIGGPRANDPDPDGRQARERFESWIKDLG